MPVSFNSPPRNFFLLGSGAQQALTNFFETVPRFTGTDRFSVSDIAYSETDQKYILSGSGKDSNSVSFGWLEKQDYDEATTTNVEAWRQIFESTLSPKKDVTLNFMKQTDSYGGDIIIGGKVNNIPWVARYDTNGAQQWVSSSFSGDLEYFGIACTASGYYACGHRTDATGVLGISESGFVEKWTDSGTPLWGKSAVHVNGSVKYNAIAANDRAEVVVVGAVTDQAYVQGYVAKLDANTGDVLWDKTINSGRAPSLGFRNDVEVKNVYIDGKDQIYVVGTEFADTFPVYQKGFIIKYSAEGNLIWHKTTPADENHDFLDLWSDTPVEQTVVLSRETVVPPNGNTNLQLLKYSKNGDLVFKRRIITEDNTGKPPFVQSTAGLDGDPSFYYMLFVDQEDNVSSGTSKQYTFGQVSASGNGFGDFEYNTGVSFAGEPQDITYTVSTSGNPIGRLADGSVRNDTSDFISYPYSGLNLLLGDDLATNVSYKKTRHKDKDLFEYSGSPAQRIVDFQEANLLGDVYSGSGDWLDQSGNGNSAEVSDQEPFPNTGAIKLENASSDYFEIPYSSNWILGPIWTIEFYIKTKTRRSDKLIGTRGDSSPSGWEIVYNDGQIGVEQYGTESTGGQQRTSERVPLRKWTHVAVVNYNGGVKIYYDGVDTGFNWTGSSTSSWPAGGNHVLRIGKPTAFNEAPHVLMSNIHIVKGSALYTSAFSVPAIPLEKTTGTVLLTARGSTMSDDSDSNHSISANAGATIGDEFFNADYNSTDECWQFNGSSGNYMSIPNFTSANNINFSIEVWWKADSLPSYSGPTSKGYIFDQTPISDGIALRLSTAGDITTFAYPNTGTISNPTGGAVRLVSSGTAVQTGVWYHTVSVFETNKVSLYVNGTLVGTNTGAMNYVAAGVIDQSYPFTIGSGIDTSAARNYEYLDGKIGEFRIYQKVLTAAEVFQNHNATKHKYGGVRPFSGAPISPGFARTLPAPLASYDFNSALCVQRTSSILPSTYQFKVQDAVPNGAAKAGTECVATGYGKVVVGARGDDNGVYTRGGRAFVYNVDGTGQVILTPSGPVGNDMFFGNSVDICNCNGKIAVASASSLHIFDVDGTGEILIDSSTTLPISPPGGSTFGNSVAIDGDKVWVSDHNVPQGTEGNGTVYCFDVNTGAFLYQLRPKKSTGFSRFGVRIKARDGLLIIGADTVSHPVTGRLNTGRMYLYRQDGTNERIIEPEELTTSADFGISGYAIGYGMILVGAMRQQRVEGAFTVGSGEVFAFDYKGNKKFSVRPSDDPTDENLNGMGFGGGIAISSDRIFIGAEYFQSGGGFAGKVYSFSHAGKELQSFQGSDTIAGDNFGTSAHASDGTLVIGAPTAGNTGAAYIYPVTNTPSGVIQNLTNITSTGNNATIVGATFDRGGYLIFDGVNDYLDLGSGIAITETDGWAVEGWFKFPDPSSNNTAGAWNYLFRLSPATSGGPNYEVGMFGTDNSFEIKDNGSAQQIITCTTTPNTWHFICFGQTGVGKLFLKNSNADGSFTTVQSTSAATSGSPAGFDKLFSSQTGGNNLNAHCGEIRIYNREILTPEFTVNYGATRSKYGI